MGNVNSGGKLPASQGSYPYVRNDAPPKIPAGMDPSMFPGGPPPFPVVIPSSEPDKLKVTVTETTTTTNKVTIEVEAGSAGFCPSDFFKPPVD